MDIDKEILKILSQRYGYSEEEIILALEEYDKDVKTIVNTTFSSLNDIIDTLCDFGDDTTAWFTGQREMYLTEHAEPRELWDCINVNSFNDKFLSNYSTTEHCVWQD